MEICNPDKCTGCFACANICPTDAIYFEENKTFELHPIIDKSKCINCNKCRQVCPTNNIKKIEFKDPYKCFAAWNKNSIERANSASGGIGTALAELIIDEGGCLWSTAYDKNLVACVQKENNINRLDRFKGSKYVFSAVNLAFREIKKDLESGIKVLFIGTPCQIAGLTRYLMKKYINLFTCDLICHGTTPSKCLTDEIAYLSKKKKIANITNISFRGNKNNNFKFILYSNNKILYKVEHDSQYYFSGFLKGITLRDNCYSCPYARDKRIADITIGDFIGLGDEVPIEYKDLNASVVLINSKKGFDLYKHLINKNINIKSIERDYSEALEKGTSLKAPFTKSKYREKYLELLKKDGFVIAIRTILKKDVNKNKYKNIITLSYRIPRKMYRLIIRKLNDR